MDIRRWESLWKARFATIGIANLFFFFVILFVYTLDNSTLLWILIAIESTCYLGVLIVRLTYSSTSALILMVSNRGLRLGKLYLKSNILIPFTWKREGKTLLFNTIEWF